MPSNIEIKARIASVEALAIRVAPLATAGPTPIAQDDTFFNCPNGRLKLRQFSADAGELIFYRRADAAGPKTSTFTRVPTTEPQALRDALAQAWGTAGRVRKQRLLYLVGRTRVHLDVVEGLGHFMELEVVLADGDDPAEGVREAESLVAALGVPRCDWIDVAYVDLLAASRA